MSTADLKQRLRDVPGIEGLTMQTLLGRQVFGFDGKIAAVDPGATPQQIEEAIRNAAAVAERPLEPIAAALNDMLAPSPATTPLPTVNITEAPLMTTPAAGSFAASLKAMIDEAHAGVEKARADGRAIVGAAVDKLNGVKAATTKVASGMAQQIEDVADAALSDLGQISNDL